LGVPKRTNFLFMKRTSMKFRYLGEWYIACYITVT
jgi:hypothetical protein